MPEDLTKAASEYTPVKNFDSRLSVPTYVTKITDTWFIVDCYHNRVIYSDSLDTPLNEWNIMTSDATRPHTIASDGNVYMIDDTDNNRILIFEKVDDKFIHTQSFYDIGIRPHYTVYDRNTDTFYVWSSMTGELFCFRTDTKAFFFYTPGRIKQKKRTVYISPLSVKIIPLPSP